MSLASPSVHPIPEETRRVAQAALPRPSRFMQMRPLEPSIRIVGNRQKCRGTSRESPSCSLLTP